MRASPPLAALALLCVLPFTTLRFVEAAAQDEGKNLIQSKSKLDM